MIIFYIIFIIVCISVDIIRYQVDFNTIINRFNYFKFKKTDILMHGASCGESQIAIPIIKKLENFHTKVNLSVTTPTGFKLVRKYTDNVFLKPYDEIFSMLIMFAIMRPKTLIIIERDVWPFYILFAKIFNCRIFFINYKIKNKITDRIHYLLADKIFTINECNSLKKKYIHLGDLKLLDLSNNSYKKSNKFLFIVIASAGRDEIDIHKKYISYLLKYPNIKIIYVPRHLNWKKTFKEHFKCFNYIFINNIKDIYHNKISVCWKIGLLNQIYKHSHICLMGDTFNNVGGHNLLEPGISNNIILTGPNISTCKHQIKLIPHFYLCNNLSDLILISNRVIKNYYTQEINNTVKILKTKKYIENKLDDIIKNFLII